MQYTNNVIRVEFDPVGGGFPSQIFIKHIDGEIPALTSQRHFLSIGLSDGRIATPFLPSDYEPIRVSYAGADRLYFDTIPFRDQHGKLVEKFLLSLRYEFWDDGTVFVRSYFVIDESVHRPGISAFTLTVPLNLERFDSIDQASTGMIGRPSDTQASVGHDAEYDDIIPSFNFNCKARDGTAAYFEVFMEKNHSLARAEIEKAVRADTSENVKDHGAAGSPKSHPDRTTRITWKNGNPMVCWNFQAREMPPPRMRPWEWRNQWGWLFTAPPVRRRLPPLRMYHLMDYFEYRVPTIEQVEHIAAAGADAIVLHEPWRLDVGGSSSFPYCREGLRKFIQKAHSHNIRVVLYIRGHGEPEISDEYADWFPMLLKYDFDGLYMDFGGARNAGRDSYGNIPFHRHYLKMRRLRERIGPHGLLFAHSGRLFTAVGLTPNLIDGYVAGEGEYGLLTQNRFSHESLSGVYVTIGTIWTAAFPHYTEGQIIPFMASVGQYPHAPLGADSLSCSLEHPNFPGINDIYLRPLWKLWGTFKGQQDVNVFTEYNSRGVLAPGDSDTGAFMMLAEQGRIGLLILSNFSNQARRLAAKVNWTAAGLKEPASAWRLTPTTTAPGQPAAWTDLGEFAADAEAFGCVGFLFGAPEALTAALEEFSKPYPPPPEESVRHMQQVAEQRRLRQAPLKPMREIFIKVSVPPAIATMMCYASLYTVFHEIGTLDDKGGFLRLGFISMKGFHKEPPLDDDIIWAAAESPWIALHSLLPERGVNHVAIKSLNPRRGYFQSLIEVTVSPRPDAQAEGAYKLVFMNEVESKAETLHFDINLEK